MVQMPDAVLLPTGDVFVCNGGQNGRLLFSPHPACCNIKGVANRCCKRWKLCMSHSAPQSCDSIFIEALAAASGSDLHHALPALVSIHLHDDCQKASAPAHGALITFFSENCPACPSQMHRNPCIWHAETKQGPVVLPSHTIISNHLRLIQASSPGQP